jgi:1,4-alpha-glucan branching enzyme
MFFLFAPTIIDPRLVGSFSQWEEVFMDRQDNDQWIDIIDPYVTKYDPERNIGIMWIKEGKRLLNDAMEYKWKYDHIQLPENNDLVIYEIYVADIS